MASNDPSESSANMVSHKASISKNAQLKQSSQYHSTSSHDHEHSSSTDNQATTNQDWWLDFG